MDKHEITQPILRTRCPELRLTVANQQVKDSVVCTLIIFTSSVVMYFLKT